MKAGYKNIHNLYIASNQKTTFLVYNDIDTLEYIRVIIKLHYTLGSPMGGGEGGGTDITATSTQTTTHKIILLILLLSLLIIIPIYLLNTPNSPRPYSIRRSNANNSTNTAKRCDIFRGKWVPSQKEPYYTNSTCSVIYNLQNCLKFGRVDKEFLKWRWKPDQCYLPMFDAVQFLELVRGKSMAFVGDSVGRNHMQSLICLLARVSTNSII